MATQTYTKAGTKATTAAKLDESVFGIAEINHELLKAVYVSYLANGRQNSAVTKTRGLVSGGGKKPWRQKGTGRARFGSSRNPIWRGGGVAFGPTGIENYTHKITQVSRQQAIRQALSQTASEGRLKVIESFESKDGKVAEAQTLLQKIEAEGQILIVVAAKSNLVERSTRNLPGIKTIQANYLNVFEIMNADMLVVEQKALDMIHDWLNVAVVKTAEPIVRPAATKKASAKEKS